MPEQPRVVIEGQDRTGHAFRSVAAHVAYLRTHATTATAGVVSLGNLGRNAIGGLLGPLRLASVLFSLVSSLVGSVIGAVTGLASSVLNLAGAIGGALWGTATRVFGYLATGAKAAVLGLAAAMGVLAKRGVDVNLSLGSTERGLGVMLKSVGAARSLVAGLREFAEQSVSRFVDLAGWARQLVAFRFGVTQIIPILRTLGDTVAGLSGGPDMMGRLILAFGQMKAKGFLQGEEVMQLLEAGVPALDYLQRARLLKPGQDVARARIPSMVGIQTILAGMRGDFGGMQQGAMSSLPGILSNIGDAVDRLTAKVTTGLLGSLTRAAKVALDFVGNLDKTKQGQRFLGIIEQAFNGVGRAIERLAGRLPYFLERLTGFLDSGRLRTFRDWAERTFNTLKDGAVKAVGWFSQNWDPMWSGIRNTAVGALKLVVGTIYGLLAVYREWDSQHGSIGEKLQSLAETAKQFGIAALMAMKPLVVQTTKWIGLIITAMLTLKMAMLGATFGAAVGGPVGAGIVGASMAMIGTALGARIARDLTLGVTRGFNRAITELDALNTSKVAAGFGKGLPVLGSGTFGTGFRQGVAAVDAFLTPSAIARQPAAPYIPVATPAAMPRATAPVGPTYVPSERLRPGGSGGSWRERNSRGSDLGGDPASEAARHLESAAAAIRRMPRAAQEVAARELALAYGGANWG